jgi:hypothetical protein
LARLCLYSSADNVALLLNLIQNIIKQHPKSLILLIRKRKKTESEKRNELKENSKFISNKLPEEVTKKEQENEDMELKVDANGFEGIAKYEQFDEGELDPYKTRAHASSLWELYTLRNHFSHKIRSLIHKFEFNFLKLKENNIDELSNVTEEDLLYDLGSSNFYINYENKTPEQIFNKLNKFI